MTGLRENRGLKLKANAFGECRFPICAVARSYRETVGVVNPRQKRRDTPRATFYLEKGKKLIEGHCRNDSEGPVLVADSSSAF